MLSQTTAPDMSITKTDADAVPWVRLAMGLRAGVANGADLLVAVGVSVWAGVPGYRPSPVRREGVGPRSGSGMTVWGAGSN